MNTRIMAYINELKRLRDLLADILNEKAITASKTETYNTLIPKVKSIRGSEWVGESGGTILSVPFMPSFPESISIGTAEEFEIMEV